MTTPCKSIGPLKVDIIFMGICVRQPFWRAFRVSIVIHSPSADSVGQGSLPQPVARSGHGKCFPPSLQDFGATPQRLGFTGLHSRKESERQGQTGKQVL